MGRISELLQPDDLREFRSRTTIPANTNSTPIQSEYGAIRSSEDSHWCFARCRELIMKSLMLSVIEMSIVVSPIRCSVFAMRVEDSFDSRAWLRSEGRLWVCSAAAILLCSLTTRSPVSRCPSLRCQKANEPKPPVVQIDPCDLLPVGIV